MFRNILTVLTICLFASACSGVKFQTKQDMLKSTSVLGPLGSSSNVDPVVTPAVPQIPYTPELPPTQSPPVVQQLPEQPVTYLIIQPAVQQPPFQQKPPPPTSPPQQSSQPPPLPQLTANPIPVSGTITQTVSY